MTTATASRPRGITVRVVDVRPPIIVKTDLRNFQAVVQKLTGKRKINDTCGGISDDDEEHREHITNEELEEEEEDEELNFSAPSWSKCSNLESPPPIITTKPRQGHHGASSRNPRADDGSISTNWSSSLSSEDGVSPSPSPSVPQQEVTSSLMDNHGAIDMPLSLKRAKLSTINHVTSSDHYVVSMDSLVSELLSTDYNNNGVVIDGLSVAGSNNTNNNYTSLSCPASSFNDHFDFINTVNLPDFNPVNSTSFHDFGELDKFSFPFFNI